MNAFVTSTVIAPAGASTFVATTSRTAPYVSSRSATSTVMMTEKPKGDKPKLGFTLTNETINGRAAMAGFLIALVTEVANKDHPTIVQQVMSVLPF
eukprot:CAMPEP_0174908650 /NCGR_PEP_ID=MMETSP0167-20121228/65326_1 /TAXON_ID=38298 /ORGANISM="Rhodella maculata, Strain CCMP736" /LENGTH=95 /DNA_ID=CAMNT_0016152451 /DNA_START=319 /DNA_END=606 /DNA_ORIENTATION=+